MMMRSYCYEGIYVNEIQFFWKQRKQTWVSMTTPLTEHMYIHRIIFHRSQYHNSRSHHTQTTVNRYAERRKKVKIFKDFFLSSSTYWSHQFLLPHFHFSALFCPCFHVRLSFAIYIFSGTKVSETISKKTNFLSFACRIFLNTAMLKKEFFPWTVITKRKPWMTIEKIK